MKNMNKVAIALSKAAIMQNLQEQRISQRTQVLIEKLLLGRFTIAEIAKVTGIPEQWLQSYVNSQYEFVAERVLSAS
jgi:phage portal protein BeeE